MFPDVPSLKNDGSRLANDNGEIYLNDFKFSKKRCVLMSASEKRSHDERNVEP